MSERTFAPVESAKRRRVVAAVVLINAALLSVIGATFFVEDYRYSLPTPRPANFHPVSLGKSIALPNADRRPALLCFASPDCGCSRFNQDHLWELSREFGKRVRLIEVIEASESGGLDSPDETILDPNGKLAKACGVYSTPQAVVLNQDRRIVYSGNFNSARFCSEPSTQFARLTLEAVLAGKQAPAMPKRATTPYGCVIASEVNSK
jgi:hypothetical protein